MHTLIVNFKTYEHGTGRKAIELVTMCAALAHKHPTVSVLLALQPADLCAAHQAAPRHVISQHIDAIYYGAHTGHILLESIQEQGAIGSLMNHSEKRIPEKDILYIIKRLKKRKMLSVLCVKSASEVKKYRKYEPHVMALEPPELIGGNVSVSTTHPGVIKHAVAAAGKIPLLVGAGVHTAEDVRIALSLGAQGVLVASDILKSTNPKKELLGLLDGFLI